MEEPVSEEPMAKRKLAKLARDSRRAAAYEQRILGNWEEEAMVPMQAEEREEEDAEAVDEAMRQEEDAEASRLKLINHPEPLKQTSQNMQSTPINTNI